MRPVLTRGPNIAMVAKSLQSRGKGGDVSVSLKGNLNTWRAEVLLQFSSHLTLNPYKVSAQSILKGVENERGEHDHDFLGNSPKSPLP